MAIIVSDSRNPAYDGNLTTANAWWRVEASNLSGQATTSLSLSSTRVISVTFANAGNLRGVSVALGIPGVPSAVKGTVTAVLKESGVTRQTVNLTKASIYGNRATGTQDTSPFAPTFEFNYPVTTAAGVWTIEISNSGAESANWELMTSNGTAPFFVAWCDNQLTASSTNDCLVIRSPISVNASFTTKCNGLGTGDTTNGASIVLLTSSDISSPDNICNLRWASSPAASYTLTIDGVMLTAADSGWRIGTTTTAIPFAQQAIVIFPTTPSFGTARGVIALRRSNSNCGGSSFIFNGEVPAEAKLEVASNANTGQPNVVMTTSPTTWQAGDRVWFPKTSSSIPSYSFYTISSISGSTVTMTGNINPQIIATSVDAPSYGINFERFGIRIASANTSIVSITSQVPNNLYMKGVLLDYFGPATLRSQSGQNPVGINASTSQYLIEDCLHIRGTQGSMLGALEVPGNGMKINRFYSFGSLLAVQPAFTYGGGTAGGPFQNSGILEISNCVTAGSPAGASGCIFGGVGTKFENNAMYTTSGNSTSGQASIRLINFVKGTFKNNVFWRQQNCVSCETVLNPTDWSGNKFNHSAAYAYDLSGYALGVVAKNERYGQEGSNPNVCRFAAGSYTDFQIQDSLGTVTVDNTQQKNIVENNEGSLRVVNDNQVANVDRIWNEYGFIVRTGTGLADTTKRMGDYALRFESNDSANALSWAKNQPTGNIQGKAMSVGLWVNVASANYWSGTHVMPRITVTYDNGTTTYGEAAQIAGDWQWVQATFVPTTDYGQITVQISTQTDATGSNAYVYWADFSGVLPEGSVLNLGEFDLWANAFPVTPLSYASVINANDVWAANPANFGASTVGDKVNKIKNDTSLIPATL